MSIDLSKLLRDADEYEKPTRCAKCGKVLRYIGVGEYKCDACGYTDYDEYGLVRTYVERNPGANVVQVEQATGVSQKTINGMVRAGKLVIKSGTRNNILEGLDE